MTRSYSPDAAEIAAYGSSVALELPRVFVGEPDRTDGGRVYVQTLDGLNLYLEDSLAPASLAPGDDFGASLAADGSLLAVGAPLSVQGGLTTGAVFVFEEINGVWLEVGLLVPPLIVGFTKFGYSVAVEGERIVVGEPFSDGNALDDGGSVYVFDRVGGVWDLTQTLLPSYSKDCQLFGYDVALDGANLAIGAPFSIPFATTFSEIGSVYLFNFDGSSWTEADHVQPMPALKKWQFGSSVDLVGTRFLGGAQSADAFYGLAYVFDQDVSGKWVQTAILTQDGSTQFSRFGEEVQLSDDGKSAAVSATGDSVPFGQSGAVYLFSENRGTWTLDQKLKPIDPVNSLRFGRALALQANVLSVGASFGGSFSADEGAIHLHSLDNSACSSLIPTARSVSLALGSLVTFLVDPGAEFSGKTYLIAGSLAGSDPGFTLDGLRVPLNPDAYFSLLTTSPNQGLFFANLGVLSSSGQGAGFLSLPASFLPTLAGTDVFHAAVVLDTDGTLLHVSDAALLRLDP